MKNKKIPFYILIGLASLILGIYYTPQGLTTKRAEFLETSMLSLYENIYQSMESKIEYNSGNIDLELEKVAYKKDAQNDRYIASLKIKNNGNHIKDLHVIVGNSANDNFISIKNSDNGLSLSPGEEFIFNDYYFSLAHNVSGGEFDFSLTIQDEFILESDISNNTKTILIDEFKSDIKDLYLKNINNDGQFSIDYNFDKYSISDKSYEIFFAKSLNFENSEYKYLEYSDYKNVYSYGRIPLSKTLIDSTEWLSISTDEKLPLNISVFKDPFKDNQEYYIYLKEIDHSNKTIRYSDFLYFYPQNYLSKAEFSKLFVESIGLKPAEMNSTHYLDLDNNSKYISYISSIYDLGLFNIESDHFNPNSKILRSEALKIIMDYFDIDFYSNKSFDSRFIDVSEESEIYHYVQSLASLNKGEVFGQYLQANKFANAEYINYLIDEFKESN